MESKHWGSGVAVLLVSALAMGGCHSDANTTPPQWLFVRIDADGTMTSLAEPSIDHQQDKPSPAVVAAMGSSIVVTGIADGADLRTLVYDVDAGGGWSVVQSSNYQHRRIPSSGVEGVPPPFAATDTLLCVYAGECFDLAAAAWYDVADQPFQPFAYAAAGVDLYSLAFDSTAVHVDQLDPASKSWMEVQAPPCGSASLVDSKVIGDQLVLSGCGGSGVDAYRYDPANGMWAADGMGWSDAAVMGYEFSELAGNRVYFCGSRSPTCRVHDLSTGTTADTAALPLSNGEGIAAVASDGESLFAFVQRPGTETLYRYDDATSVWVSVVAIQGLYARLQAFVAVDGKLYALIDYQGGSASASAG